MKERLALLEAEWFSREAREALGSHFSVTEFDDRCSVASVLAEFDVVVLRLSTRIRATDVPDGARCRLIAVPATGLDHIDSAALMSRGIDVIGLKHCRGSIEGISATAELTVGLLVALARRIPAATQAVSVRGEWNRNDFRGTQLAGLTAGIVGLGRIGARVGRMLDPFDMSVCYFDTDPARAAPPLRRMDSLTDLLGESDVILLHASIDNQPLPILGRNELAACKEGALLVNTARGQLVDTRALIDLLREGRLGGAALDVVDGEPDRIPRFVNEYAAEFDNLILTPHIGGNTVASVRMADMVLVDEIISRFKP